MERILVSVAITAGLVGLVLVARRRAALLAAVRTPQAATVLLLALPAAVLCQLAQTHMWEWTGLSPKAGAGPASEALIAVLLFSAPLTEGAKVLCLWPLYRSRRILSVRQGAALGLLVGLGFGVTDIGWVIATSARGWEWLQVVVALPAHAACAVAWSSCLGLRGRSLWFPASWTAAMLLHGLHDHFIWGRGPGLLVLALPLLLTCTGLAYGLYRRARTKEQSGILPGESLPPEAQLSGWSEPPSVREVWRALQPQQSRLMLPWIAVGALVTAGVAIASLAAALYLGQVMGLDFAAADEADVRSNGPLLFLATALALSFPISGYLVARASASVGLLEPALGSAVAVLGAVLLLSITTPVAAVFALAVAPIAFGLSSGGAWFALDR